MPPSRRKYSAVASMRFLDIIMAKQSRALELVQRLKVLDKHPEGSLARNTPPLDSRAQTSWAICRNLAFSVMYMVGCAPIISPQYTSFGLCILHGRCRMIIITYSQRRETDYTFRFLVCVWHSAIQARRINANYSNIRNIYRNFRF